MEALSHFLHPSETTALRKESPRRAGFEPADNVVQTLFVSWADISRRPTTIHQPATGCGRGHVPSPTCRKEVSRSRFSNSPAMGFVSLLLRSTEKH